jgi:hypothetical protein
MEAKYHWATPICVAFFGSEQEFDKAPNWREFQEFELPGNFAGPVDRRPEVRCSAAPA